MAIIAVSQLKSGEKLIEDVLTYRGNVLLQKGIRLTQREIEILKAFMIRAVEAEPVDGQTVETSEEDAAAPVYAVRPVFNKVYDEMIQLLRKVFLNATPGIPLPIFEVRTKLERLIQAAADYKPLTFTPRNYQKDDYLYHNSILVALTCYQFAIWHGLPKKDWLPVAMGGLLHDIGSLSVDQQILRKPGKLGSHELDEIRRHTIIGYNILKSAPGINDGVKFCALQHHEREDGSGYPLGLKGDKIHYYAKMVAIADVFHAMTANRFHKSKMSPYLALEKLHDESFGKLEPTMVQTFIQKSTQIQNGSIVKLSNHALGEIVFSDPKHPTRPWVKVNDTIVNLATNRNLYIQEVVKIKK
jgi:HD-GYP domain-containing protein (c-di-GMP phosphodiesterase class II)